MSGSIRISEKHGVNPSLGVCFWCGEDDGTVLLLGRLPGDKEAPRRACVTKEPCEKCKKTMALGITLIEATEVDHEPTGRWCVITEDAARRMIEPTDVLEAVLRHRKCFMSPEAFQMVQP